MALPPRKSFLITGVSAGFGRALSEAALAVGHHVVGTVRKETDRAAFEALHPHNAKAKLLDVTDINAIAPMIAEIEAEIGAIDVLVNNAGYGFEGAVEESPLEELRRQMEVNLFGAVAVIQAVLPYMRKRRAGHIINITAMAAFMTSPGISFYHASKFALEGLSASLGKEVKGFGIAVTAVAPGGFRTEWAGRSMVRGTRSISDYDSLLDPLREARRQRSGHQAGDPKKAARAMLALVELPNPPAHLLLGSDALKRVGDTLDGLKEEIDAWRELTLSTDYTG